MMNVLTEVLQHIATFSANDTGAALTAGANSENRELESIGHWVRNMYDDHVTVNGKNFSLPACPTIPMGHEIGDIVTAVTK